MKFHRRLSGSIRFHAVFFAISLVVLSTLIPTPAHAIGESLIRIGQKAVIEGGLAIGSFIVNLETWAITQLANGIEFAIAWQNVSNNEVVYNTWTVVRDMVNMTFIVGLIIISFATIFRPLNIFRSFYYRDILPKLLLAAVLINLSLGLSQAVLQVSNKITVTLTNILGNTTQRLDKILYAERLLATPLQNTDPSLSNKALLQAYGLGDDTVAGPTAEQVREYEEAYAECRKESAEGLVARLGRWGKNAWSVVSAPFGGSVNISVGTRPTKTAEQCQLELANAEKGSGVGRVLLYTSLAPVGGPGLGAAISAAAVGYKIGQALGTAIGSSAFDVAFGMRLLIAQIFAVIMLFMVICSLLAGVIFFLFRIVALWFLMAFSAFAFGLMWIPGEYNPFQKWWNMFLGWNVFGPMYLLVLIFGMTFLVQRGALLATAGPVNSGALFLETTFSFLFTLVVFIGGLQLALNSSFRGAVAATPIIGRGAERFGAFSALTFSRAIGLRAPAAAVRGAARGAGAVYRISGAQGYVQAGRERIAQEYRARRPEVLRFRSQEEKLASARSRLGVAGGAQEDYRQFTTRVQASQRDLMNLMNSQVIRNPGESTAAFRQRQNNYLRQQTTTGDNASRYAARQELLSRGQLSADEIRETGELAGGGNLGRAEFERAVDESAVNDPRRIVEYRMEEFQRRTGNGPGSPAYITELQAQQGRHFNTILNNPAALAKLRDEYRTPGTPEFQVLKRLIDQRWPASDTRNRQRAKSRFLTGAQNAQHAQGVRDLFA